MDLVHPAVTAYLEQFVAGEDDPVLLEMEAHAADGDFPIIGRLCGQALEVLARAGGARRVVELGSGFGYSGWWFARALGPDGELHLTDGDPENLRLAEDFFARAGITTTVHRHVGDAVAALDTLDGEFDIVYCDIDKDGYPEAWRHGRRRVRVGGMFICDNVLWYGRVTGADVEDRRPQLTEAIREMTTAIAEDPDWRSFVLPLRDGVLVATRVR